MRRWLRGGVAAARPAAERRDPFPLPAPPPLCRGERGYALILLQPHELPYADLLRAAGLTLSQRSSADTLCRLAGAALPRSALGLRADTAAPAAAAAASSRAGIEDGAEDADDDILGVAVPEATAAEQRASAAARLGLDADAPSLAGVDLRKFSAFAGDSQPAAGAAEGAAAGDGARSGEGVGGGSRARSGQSRLLGLVEAAAAAAARVRHRGSSALLSRGGGPDGGGDSSETPALTRSAEMQVCGGAEGAC